MEFPAYHPFRSPAANEQYLKFYDQKAAEWPIPSESRTIDTSYGSTLVRISGPAEAPPLVLLPGSNGNSLMWAMNIKAFSESYQTYAVDNIYDFGRSVYTRRPKNSADFVQWLDELFKGLEFKNNVNLLGLSFGGWLACHYALRFPNRLARLVLLSPAATVLPLRLEFILRAFRYEKLMYWLLEDLLKQGETGRIMAKTAVDELLMGKRCFKPKPDIFPTVLKDQDLESLQVPTLFMIGSDEPMYSAQKALTRLHKVAPQIKTELIPNVGHVITIVKPDLVQKKVLEFLK